MVDLEALLLKAIILSYDKNPIETFLFNVKLSV